jgi:hypothetical protein
MPIVAHGLGRVEDDVHEDLLELSAVSHDPR